MRYSEDIIENVRTSNDIVDVIGSYVRLKRSGANYFGLCPFHNEKTGSFSVSPSKQIYHCFGCGEGGNVISFIMKYENYSFQEAIKYLAEKAGIALPEAEESEEEKKAASLRARILDANKTAAFYYYKKLYSESGSIGLKYFRGRNLSDETIKNFGLGFSGKGGAEVVNYLKSKGFDDHIIKEAGLCTISEKYGMSDRFWNRVMFPIMDINNHVIGFGGRVLGQGEPKYLNTAETKVFDKSRNMYGLNVARHSKKDYRIVCEGYIDVISMHQAGFTEAVASLGTAFTSGHASLLRRYTKEVRLIYDSDAAGIKAALRAIPICDEAGLVARVVDLSPHKDPDEFINALGAEEFQKRLDNAENAFFFSLRIAERDYNLNDPEGRTAFLSYAASKLADIEDELKRENYISAVAAKYMTNENTLKKAVVNEAVKKEGSSVRLRTYRQTETKDKDPESDNSTVNAEKYLLTWLTDDISLYKEISDYLDFEDFTEGVTRDCARLLFAQLKEGKCEPASIIDRFEDEEKHKKVAQIFSTKLDAVESSEEKSRALTDLVVKVKEASLKRQAEQDSPDEGESMLQKRIRIRKAMDELKSLKIEI
ncbi:MAG: DNA primase [Lachnospiraceae bacterium]|nr:DNA primase [Lachnospiraceae bacterium]